MPATTDAPAGGAEDQEHDPDDQQDDPNRAENGDMEKVTQDEQDDSQNDHRSSFGLYELGWHVPELGADHIPGDEEWVACNGGYGLVVTESWPCEDPCLGFWNAGKCPSLYRLNGLDSRSGSRAGTGRC